MKVFGASGIEWFVRGLTLLVIACPSALVIATPVTVGPMDASSELTSLQKLARSILALKDG